MGSQNLLGDKFWEKILSLYEQVVSAIWAIMVLTPVETLAYNFYHGSSVKIKDSFWPSFYIFTVIFLASSFSLPYIRKKILRLSIDNFCSTKKISKKEKSTLYRITSSNIMCKSFLSKEGRWHFFSTNLSNISMMAAYFAIDEFVDTLSGRSESSAFSVGVFLFLFILGDLAVKISDHWQRKCPSAKLFTEGRGVKAAKLMKIKLKDTEKSREVFKAFIRLVAKDSMDSASDERVLDDAFEAIKSLIKMTGGASAENSLANSVNLQGKKSLKKNKIRKAKGSN